jgi:hypothetical protein
MCEINLKKKKKSEILTPIGSGQSYAPSTAFHSCDWPDTLKTSYITNILLSLYYLSIHLNQNRHPDENIYIPSIRGKFRTKFPYLFLGKQR